MHLTLVPTVVDFLPDNIIGPAVVSALLFIAVLANFIIRGKFPTPCSSFLLTVSH